MNVENVENAETLDNDNVDIESFDELKEEYLKLVEQFKDLIKETPEVAKTVISRNLVEAKKTIDDGIAGKVASINEAKAKLAQAKTMVIESTKQRAKEAKDTVVYTAKKKKKGVKETPGKIKGKAVDVAETVALHGMEATDKLKSGIKTGKETVVRAGKGLALTTVAAGIMAGDLAVKGGHYVYTGAKTARENAVNKSKEIRNLFKSKIQDGKLFFLNKAKQGKKWLADKAETIALHGMEAKDKVVDVAETVALHGMEAKDKVVDVAETVALHGMEAVDKTKQGINTAKTTVREGINTAKTTVREGIDTARTTVREGIDTAKTTVREGIDTAKTTVREGIDATKTNAGKIALEIGKKTYKGAAMFTAFGELAIEGAAKGAGYVSEGVSKGIDAGKEKVSEVAQVGKNYTEMSAKKVALTKTKAKIGFKSFIKGMAQKLVDKLGQSLGKDQELAQELEQGIEFNKNNLEELNGER